jgi:tripartite ATP-independent transporter DctM subunit
MVHDLTGSLRGGLAIGTVLLMVLISAMNGLSVAGMAVGCSIALPEMLKRGYDKKMISGVIQGGSSLGILMPPSVVMVLYGMIARQPVGELWLAGVLPALLMAGLFIAYIAIRCHLQPELAPTLSAEDRSLSWGQKLKSLSAGIPMLFIIFLVIGLFFMGITSLVESSAVGALTALILAAVKRRLTMKSLKRVMRQTLFISSMFMWIIMAALCFSSVFDGLGAVKAIRVFFLGELGMSPWQVLLLMQVSFILLGMFLDDTAMLIIVAPLYIPLVAELGFSLIWFGVLYTITCQIAYLTPPFGYNLFLMRAMSPSDITLGDIYRSVVPFVALMFLTLLIIMVFPQVTLWLPGLLMPR